MYTKKHSWTLSSGKIATVTVDLQIQKRIWLDGHESMHPCCDIWILAEVEGQGIVGSDEPQKILSHPQAIARIGRLALTQDNYDAVMSMIAAIKAVPEWQAKIAAEKIAVEAQKKYYASQKLLGVCPHCGTICHGDCQAN